MITITEVRITPIEAKTDDDKLKAFANVTIDDSICITGLRIVKDAKGGLFVGMPSRKVGDEYKDVIFPITKESRAYLHGTVLKAYDDYIKNPPAPTNKTE